MTAGYSGTPLAEAAEGRHAHLVGGNAGSVREIEGDGLRLDPPVRARGGDPGSASVRGVAVRAHRGGVAPTAVAACGNLGLLAEGGGVGAATDITEDVIPDVALPQGLAT